MCYTRKLEGVKNINDFQEKISEYRQHNLVEGFFSAGDNMALIDDLVTKLDSKLIALEQLKSEANKRKIGINCKNVNEIVNYMISELLKS